MKVREAAAGATRLTSPQESANSRLKKATAMAVTPKEKVGIAERAADHDAEARARRHKAPTSPTCFMARARSTSPTTEAKHDGENCAPGVEQMHDIHD